MARAPRVLAVRSRTIGSGIPTQGPNDYPGQRLGLPQSGPRSLARLGRRIAALFVDWLISYGLAALAMTLGLLSLGMLSTAVLVIWLVLGVVSVRLFGFTPGQLALGLQVVPVDHRSTSASVVRWRAVCWWRW